MDKNHHRGIHILEMVMSSVGRMGDGMVVVRVLIAVIARMGEPVSEAEYSHSQYFHFLIDY